MNLIINFLLSALAVFIVAYVVPGVSVDSFFTALVVAVVLGILNLVVKPIITLLTLPLNILTLGLLGLIINLVIIYMASALISGFTITSLLSAILFGILLAIINMLMPHNFTNTIQN